MMGVREEVNSASQFSLVTKRRTYLFEADSASVRKEWVLFLKNAIAMCRSAGSVPITGGDMHSAVKQGYLDFGGCVSVLDKAGWAAWSSKAVTGWPKRYVAVSAEKLCYYANKEDYDVAAPLYTMPLLLASVRVDKQRLINITTNTARYIFRAATPEEASEWRSAIQEGIVYCTTHMGESTGVWPTTVSAGARQSPPSSATTVPIVATGGIASADAGSAAPVVTDDPAAGAGPASRSKRLSTLSTPSEGEAGGRSRTSFLLAPTLATLPPEQTVVGDAAWNYARTNVANRYCADCGASDPEWASINLGVMLCLECSGVHRSLGVHVSKVRSLLLDKWPEVQLQLLCAIGTMASNEFWEGECGDGYAKPMSDSLRAEREEYIRAKYANKQFCRLFAGDADSLGRELCTCVAQPDSLVRSIALMASGASVDFVDASADGRTPLHVAALSGQTLQALLLMLNGASPLASDSHGRTPLDYAEEHQQSAVAQLLARNMAKHALSSVPAGAVSPASGIAAAAGGSSGPSGGASPKANMMADGGAGDFAAASHKIGYLYKQGGSHNNKGWRRRFFVFEEECLRYFKSEADRKPAGQIFVREMTSVYETDEDVERDQRYRYCFEIATCTPRDYILCAETDADMQSWIATLLAAIKLRGTVATVEGFLKNPTKTGYLTKRGGTFTSWRRRYFVLKGKMLYYVRSCEDTAILGVINMRRVTSIVAGDGTQGADARLILQLVTDARTYFLKADSPEDAQAWLAVLRNTKVFGAQLSALCSPDMPVPKALEDMLRYVELRGLLLQGLYRLSGTKEAMNALRIQIDEDQPDFSLESAAGEQVHEVAGLLKLFFRSLPEPLLSVELYHDFIAASGIEDHYERLQALQQAIESLPIVNFTVLKRLIKHLTRYAKRAGAILQHMHAATPCHAGGVLCPWRGCGERVEFERCRPCLWRPDGGGLHVHRRSLIRSCSVANKNHVNRMTASNLALVFGPTLMVVDATAAQASLADVNGQYKVVELMITYFSWLFSQEQSTDELDADIEEQLAGMSTTQTSDQQAAVKEALRRMQNARLQHLQSLTAANAADAGKAPNLAAPEAASGTLDAITDASSGAAQLGASTRRPPSMLADATRDAAVAYDGDSGPGDERRLEDAAVAAAANREDSSETPSPLRTAALPGAGTMISVRLLRAGFRGPRVATDAPRRRHTGACGGGRSAAGRARCRSDPNLLRHRGILVGRDAKHNGE